MIIIIIIVTLFVEMNGCFPPDCVVSTLPGNTVSDWSAPTWWAVPLNPFISLTSWLNLFFSRRICQISPGVARKQSIRHARLDQNVLSVKMTPMDCCQFADALTSILLSASDFLPFSRSFPLLFLGKCLSIRDLFLGELRSSLLSVARKWQSAAALC